MALGAILAAASFGLSLWDEYEKKNEAERQNEEQRNLYNQRIDFLNDAKIDNEKEASIISSINKAYNVSGNLLSNRMAFQTGGLLNPDVVKGIQASEIEAKRASTIADAEMNITQFNSKIESEKAGFSYQPSHYNVNYGNVLLGGLFGYRAGESVEKLLKDNKDKTIYVNKDTQDTETFDQTNHLKLNVSPSQTTNNQNINQATHDFKFNLETEPDALGDSETSLLLKENGLSFDLFSNIFS